jgi:hypothetical protein
MAYLPKSIPERDCHGQQRHLAIGTAMHQASIPTLPLWLPGKFHALNNLYIIQPVKPMPSKGDLDGTRQGQRSRRAPARGRILANHPPFAGSSFPNGSQIHARGSIKEKYSRPYSLYRKIHGFFRTFIKESSWLANSYIG